MSAVLDDPELFKKNPLYNNHEPSNYTPFYLTLFVCTLLTIVLVVFNVILCCFSKHRHYWKDSNTGNRWLLPIWVKTPAGQPPLDLKELEHRANYFIAQPVYETDVPDDHNKYIGLQPVKHQQESEI
ncbi:unnamed protein product [Bemisia tabaci]|uniref:Uncharacterized protein n=1 Tax=Bemisia tabaci TaxID=7038 RepID=A0A9P0AGI1_BEMTA|nr:PREDICTED: uncharacterized protein LOC109034476 [Bemisia tabaci]CAH0391330.1 unnamed protein product [Bemisia tabaci]